MHLHVHIYTRAPGFHIILTFPHLLSVGCYCVPVKTRATGPGYDEVNVGHLRNSLNGKEIGPIREPEVEIVPDRAAYSTDGTIEQAGLSAAVEHDADGIVIVGVSGRIQYVNSAFAAMTGYTKEEALGRKPVLDQNGAINGFAMACFSPETLAQKRFSVSSRNRRSAAETLHLVAMAIETVATARQLDCCRGLLSSVTSEFDRFKTAVEREGWVSRGSGNTGTEEDGR